MTPKVLKIVDVMAASETWPRVLRFVSFVCVPLLVIATISIAFFDAPVAVFFKSRYGDPLHLFSRQATDIGKAEPYFALTGGLWILFFIWRRAERASTLAQKLTSAEQWMLHGLLSLAVSGLLVQVLKHIFGRQRPYADAELSAHHFQPFIANYEFHSLPSGHSQVLFTVATFMIALLPKGRWVWLAIAATLAMTRVTTLNHWLSDVFAGAVVGMFGTVLTFRLMNYRKSVIRPAALSVILSFTIFGSALTASVAQADSPGPLGVGLVLGDPTGLSGNYRLGSQRSIDTALAWSFGRDPGFEIHADYLWHRPDILRAPKVGFDLHYGIGGRLMSLSDRHGDERTRLGPRLPVGLSTNFNQPALEVFGEIALVMNVIPATSADLDFGIGARVYF